MFAQNVPRTGPFVLAAMLLFTGAGPLASQVLYGRLIDDTSETPVESALVTLVDAADSTVSRMVTDSLGFFAVSGSVAGTYRLTAVGPGYPATISAPMRLANSDSLQVEFLISASVVLIDPVVVTGRNRRRAPMIVGFYDRAERGGFGTFITRDDIERRNPLRASDLLWTVPGLQVVPLGYGGMAGVRMRGNCVPTVVVDGMALRYVRSIDELVFPLDLEGVEVYRNSAAVPVEYGGLRNNCGAILLWTRRGD